MEQQKDCIRQVDTEADKGTGERPVQPAGAGAKDGEHPGVHGDAPAAGAASEASSAHRLDSIRHIYTHTHTHERREEAVLCERTGKQCIGQPCKTRPGERCPYEHPEQRPAYDTRKSKQKGRAYWLIRSVDSWYWNESGWWLTLTSAKNSRPIEKSWNSLRTRIGRTKRQEIVDWELKPKRPGFSRKEQRFVLSKYAGKDLSQLVDFHFIAIRTSEGNGVYHMFVFGDMLPASWLRHWWKHYHNGSNQLEIQQIGKDSEGRQRLMKYALAQYAAGQDAYVRTSHSKDILPPGSRERWFQLCDKVGKKAAIAIWTECMRSHITPDEWFAMTEPHSSHPTGTEPKRQGGSRQLGEWIAEGQEAAAT